MYEAIPGAWRKVTVGNNSTNFDLEFAGESFQYIELVGYVTNNAGSDMYVSMQPNAVSTNQSRHEWSAGGTNTAATLDVAFVSATGGITYFEAKLLTRSGVVRPYSARYEYMNASLAISGQASILGRWNDTSTIITKVTMHGDQASGIKAGSYFLYRGT